MNIRTYSNSLISSFQSAVRQVLADEGESVDNLGIDHPVMKAVCGACDDLMPNDHHDHEHPVADKVEKRDLAKECARLYVNLLRAKMMGDDDAIIEYEDAIRFSVCDPLWGKVLLEYRKSEEAKIPYRRYERLDDFVEPLPNNDQLKVAFVADWGTGTQTARNVMRCIAEHEPDLFIHLGDVYYSGTKREMDENFLQIVREMMPNTRIRALAGNHDLYAGGEGYYWLLDEMGQPASYLCLRNAHWQILGVGAPPSKSDPQSALASVPRIDEAEVAWHTHKMATADKRKTVMLSHYPLFTASGNIGRTEDNRPIALNPILYDAFKEQLGNIDVWLWGHEHNLVAFDPYLGLERGRCIGSGAIPVPLIWQPYKTLPNLALPDGVDHAPHIRHDVQLGHDGEHYHHGYALLTLDKADGNMAYYEVAHANSDSNLIKREEL